MVAAASHAGTANPLSADSITLVSRPGARARRVPAVLARARAYDPAHLHTYSLLI